VNADEWQVRVAPGVGGWKGYFNFYMSIAHIARSNCQWWTSRTTPRAGEEPKDQLIRKMVELQYTFFNSTDLAEADRAHAEYLRTIADQMLRMGTVQDIPNPAMAKKALRNIPGRLKPAVVDEGEEEYLRADEWFWEAKK